MSCHAVRRKVSLCLLLALAAAFSQAAVFAQVQVVTQHNDNARTGANLSETILNTSNVNAAQFGKLFSRAVSGYIYAQPLYLPGLKINGALHNVVYAATMNNDVYAFDADDPNQAAPLWHVNLGPARKINLSTADFPGQQIGVLSTPTIDTSTNTLYVVSNTSAGSSAFQLHALDAVTGQEKFGGPTTILPSCPGTGSSSVNGTVTLYTPTHIQRPGLLLSGGRVYIAFSSTGDISPYHGWIVAYSAADLTQPPLVYNDTPNGNEGGFWQGANGLTADGAGNVYAISGNGSFDAGSGPDHGNSMIKLDSTLHVLDWFTPYNSAAMNAGDLDLGSSGLMGIPGTNEFIGGGKTSVLYLVNAANMGGYNSNTDGVVQEVPLNAFHLHGGPIYWNSPAHGPTIYTWAEQDYLKAFSFASGLVVPAPISQSSFRAPAAPGDVYAAMPGGILSLSASGSQAGTGIVWACIPSKTGHGALPGVLRAFDADNLTHELWDSTQNAARDDYGIFGKFTPPTVAAGKVYVATSSGQLAVYGLLPATPPPIIPPPAPAPGTGSLTGASLAPSAFVSLTAAGTLDWAHWGLSGANSFDHKATGGGRISDKVMVGGGPQVYANSPIPFSWSDGSPTATATNTATGIYVSGTGNGFQITAPADTTPRTLRVYVGEWRAGGLLTAALSDGSAASFSNASVIDKAGPNGGVPIVYTLTYSAGAAGQHLTVRWTVATDSGGGNVSLQAATLAAASGSAPPPAAPAAPAGLTAAPGSGSAALAWGLVTGAGSYTVYRGTASGGETLLKAGLTAAAFTDTGLTNGTAYFYQVSAVGAGGESPRSAEVTVKPLAPAPPPAPAPGTGSLTGSSSSPSAAVSLTAAGTLDWAHWGLSGANSFDHKATGGGRISDKVMVGGGPQVYANSPIPFSWSDGSPTATATNTATGIYVSGTGNGFQITAPADTTPRTLRVYVGEWRAGGLLTAALSDGSAASFSNASVIDKAGPNGGVPIVYTLTYSAGAAGQHLTVRWTVATDSGGGNVSLQAATLAGPP